MSDERPELKSNPDADLPAGTVLLARAALGSPPPSPQAEAEARARALASLESGAVAPRALHETAEEPDESLAKRVWRGVRRLWPR